MMASFDTEKAFVQRLLDRLGVDFTFMPNPNAGSAETGIDVSVHAADGRTIGIQVTEADPHPVPGQARAQEQRAAAGGGWPQNDPQIVLESLVRSITRKVDIAARHSFASIDEVWLLICAGLPKDGATISTVVPTSGLSAADLNQATQAILRKSKYDRCFLLAVLGIEQAFYRWDKECGWEKSVKLDDVSRTRRDAYVNSLHRAAAVGDSREVNRLSKDEAQRVLREVRKGEADG